MDSRDVTEQAAKKFFGQFWDDLAGYWRVYDFLKLKTRRIATGRSGVNSVGDFWCSILGDKFSKSGYYKYSRPVDGQIVRIKDVFLSEWAPKLPGRIWTFDGEADFRLGAKRVESHLKRGESTFAVLDPWGKTKVLSAGFGSVRVSRSLGTEDAYAYMSLVGKDHWNCDYGIPVVLSRPVYRTFLDYAEKGSPWIEAIEGVLRTGINLPFKEFISRAIGGSLSVENESTLRYCAGLPKCFLHVTSPLSVKFKYNDSSPDVTAWTLFETNRAESKYQYTYATFSPHEHGSLENAVNFIETYARSHNGIKFCTDFDGETPRLDAAMPPSLANPEVRRKIFSEIFKGSDAWARDVLANFDP